MIIIKIKFENSRFHEKLTFKLLKMSDFQSLLFHLKEGKNNIDLKLIAQLKQLVSTLEGQEYLYDVEYGGWPRDMKPIWLDILHILISIHENSNLTTEQPSIAKQLWANICSIENHILRLRVQLHHYMF